MLRLDCAGSWGHGEVNEDVVGACGDAAWVIDGATGVSASLLNEPSDAAWFAARADRHLRRLLDEQPGIDTIELLRRVMAACRDDLEREASRSAEGPHEHPSAAIALVRAHAGAAELVTLGDCRVLHRSEEGVELFGTTALEALERRTIEQAASLLAERPDATPEEVREALLPGLLANRRLMNTEQGYWVLGTEPLAADHVDRKVVEAHPGEPFALASDGFLRLVDLFGAAGPADLLAIGTQPELEGWIGRLRAMEAEPGSMRRHPRVKRSDDASFLLCRLEG